MTIRLNGEPFEIAGPLTISALLAELKIDSRIVAVEHNVVVVKKQQYETTMIGEGDEVEIVRFVGGGQSKASGCRPWDSAEVQRLKRPKPKA